MASQTAPESNAASDPNRQISDRERIDLSRWVIQTWLAYPNEHLDGAAYASAVATVAAAAAGKPLPPG